jgi:glycosyltransferase involved in cell wall biosynthesis
MSKLPISVFIIAKNEADRIEKSINSVIKLVDEVIIIDSGSNDDTVDLSIKLGAKVLFNTWRGYVAQKIFGEQQCKNQWILNIDADEELSSDFKLALENLFKTNQPEFYVYICNMVIVHRLDNVVRKFAPHTKAIRLYNRKYAGFNFGDLNSNCHDSVKINPEFINTIKIGYLPQPILHRSLKSITHTIEKANFYSSMQADELYKKGRKILMIRIFIEPIWWFFKSYILRRYFVFGINGFIDCVIFSFTKFIRLAKLREKYLEKNYR